MNLEALKTTPPWDWPADAGATFLSVLLHTKAAPSDRILAAELAADLVAIDEELVDALLTILRSDGEPEPLRAQAAISLGAVLEEVDTEVSEEDPDDLPITERTFAAIQDSLRKLYLDARVPEEVRRRVLEASVRAPQDWHAGAVRAAFGSGNALWKLTAVFCARFVRGFEPQILEALDSDNLLVRYQAVRAAGVWEVDAAWPHVAAIVRSKTSDKLLLLAAIEAVGCIRPQDAWELLDDLTGSGDEDIAAAAEEALAAAAGILDDDDDDDGEDDEIPD